MCLTAHDIACIANLDKTLFDSVFCYFPITFRPPPDDPHGITAKDLKARLRECISASRYFAPLAFPQLLDKLDSTSPAVKVRIPLFSVVTGADGNVERCLANN